IRSGEAYTFDFGTRELINMVGLPMNEGNEAVRELLQNSKLKAMDNRVHVTDIEEIEKQAKYYRKMEKIERSRRQQKQQQRIS
ncbi:MAG: cAMP-binding protein, partial [Spirochaetaceae bacterium]